MNFRSVTYRILRRMRRLRSLSNVKRQAANLCRGVPCVIACCDHVVDVITAAFGGLITTTAIQRITTLLVDLQTLRTEVTNAINTQAPFGSEQLQLITKILKNFTRIHNILRDENNLIPAIAAIPRAIWIDMISSCVACGAA